MRQDMGSAGTQGDWGGGAGPALFLCAELSRAQGCEMSPGMGIICDLGGSGSYSVSQLFHHLDPGKVQFACCDHVASLF